MGGTVYLGGSFNEVTNNDGETQVRNNLAAIDRRTGAPTDFNPNLDGQVWALTLSPDEQTLYVGGAFRSVDGVPRNRIAAFDVATGELTDFKAPAPNNAVRALGASGSTLYVGGLFDTFGGVERLRLAAVDLDTGTLDPTWTPSASAGVKGIIVDPTKVWVAGDFFRINGQLARGLTTVTRTTGELIPIESPTYWAIDIAANGNQIFVAGGGPGGTAGAWNRTTGTQQWTVSSNGNFQGVGVFGEWVYLGGHHTKVDTDGGRIEVGQMTRMDRRTGELDTSWLPFVNGLRGVNAADADESNVYIGGDFTFVSRERHGGFAMFAQPTAE